MSATKRCASGTPPREALITSLRTGFLEFEQNAGESVVISFEQAEAFGELANLDAAFFEQFGLFALEAELFFLERLEARPIIAGFLHD
ncbi:MAG: hypothetical protein ACLQU2_22280 [Candidatus Binataceae bacterium]